MKKSLIFYHYRDLDMIFLMSYDLHGPWERNVDLHGKLNPTRGETTGIGIYNTVSFLIFPRLSRLLRLFAELVSDPVPVSFAKTFVFSRCSQVSNTAESGFFRPSVDPVMQGLNEPLALSCCLFSVFQKHFLICNFLKCGGRETVDREGVGAYIASGTQWYGYDNPETIKIKMDWLKREGYGGAFLWSLDLDNFRGDSGRGVYPLLRAINDGLLYNLC
ncbi:unnamed protein product [Gongylonema pulchrum]|uniref:Glyco_hydro_18 domain-containing protein n=1 Tax=Gongylonema pulchrum TaxID=637853 RepID=A0A183CZ78_9BILA|nr:unnamed protein product [Gongylonema pulchrum]